MVRKLWLITHRTLHGRFRTRGRSHTSKKTHASPRYTSQNHSRMLASRKVKGVRESLKTCTKVRATLIPKTTWWSIPGHRISAHRPTLHRSTMTTQTSAPFSIPLSRKLLRIARSSFLIQGKTWEESKSNQWFTTCKTDWKIQRSKRQSRSLRRMNPWTSAWPSSTPKTANNQTN